MAYMLRGQINNNITSFLTLIIIFQDTESPVDRRVFIYFYSQRTLIKLNSQMYY